MNELRYAIRTAVQFLSRLGTVHLIAPDYPLWSVEAMARTEALRTGRTPEDVLAERNATLDPYTDPFDGAQRVGQRPIWLNGDSPAVLTGLRAIDQAQIQDEAKVKANSGHNKHPMLRLHHDWSLFRPLGSGRRQAAPTTAQEKQMVHAQKLAVLPTFNSMAVESALDPSLPVAAGGLAGASDTMLLSNDDFFLMRPVGHHDIHSPLYGLVFRFQHDLGVDAAEHVSWSDGGEWPGLKFVSHVLERRFGKRHRRYPKHVHRGISASLMHETHLLFAEEIVSGMLARFRGAGKNVVMHFLFFNTVMERHREAALWSYVMFNLDANHDGMVDYDEFQALRRTFARRHTGAADAAEPVKAEKAYRAAHPGWATEEPSAARSADRVLTPRRSTCVEVEVHRRHAAIGLRSTAAATLYRFSSWDGFALADLYRNAVNVWGMSTLGKHNMWWHGAGWPWFIPDPERETKFHKSQALAEGEKLKHLAAAAAEAAAAAAAAHEAQVHAQGGASFKPTASSAAFPAVSAPGAAGATTPGTVPSSATSKVDDGRVSSPHDEDQDPDGTVACQIEWKVCLADAGGAQAWLTPGDGITDARAITVPAEEFFTAVAFANPHCGDCLLTHLVQRSGPVGLRAVLPPSDVRLPRAPSPPGASEHWPPREEREEPVEPVEPVEPHLPLGRVWQPGAGGSSSARGCNFSVAAVTASLPGWGGRPAQVLVARMLQRYAYTVGATPAEFIRLGAGGVSHTRSLLRTMLSRARTDRPPFAPGPDPGSGLGAGTSTGTGTDAAAMDDVDLEWGEAPDHTSVAMLAINDDIQDHIKSHAIVTTFVRWLEDTFPASRWKTPFEH